VRRGEGAQAALDVRGARRHEVVGGWAGAGERRRRLLRRLLRLRALTALPVSYRALGILVATAGAALLLVSVFADQLGLGGTDEFGWKQIVGAALGGLALVGGLSYAYLPTREEAEPGPGE
jgi:hypothetical protein